MSLPWHAAAFVARETDMKCNVQVQVKLSGDSGSPPVVAKADSEQRAVYYHYHYHRDFERHLVEKRSGNICAFCLLACCSFRVPSPFMYHPTHVMACKVNVTMRPCDHAHQNPEQAYEHSQTCQHSERNHRSQLALRS